MLQFVYLESGVRSLIVGCVDFDESMSQVLRFSVPQMIDGEKKMATKIKYKLRLVEKQEDMRWHISNEPLHPF